jgi:hypothetical protein
METALSSSFTVQKTGLLPMGKIGVDEVLVASHSFF